MRILNITAQKPDSTGSGIYLSELVRELNREGHTQAVIAGVYPEDEILLPPDVERFFVYFHTEELPFAIAGMSDEMPYESTVYRTMTEEMTEQFMTAFRKKIKEAVVKFRPDLILSHHLYLVTAIAKECAGSIPVYGFCHNTDLRQMRSHGLQRSYIREHIAALDRIYALHDEQKQEILELFPVEESRIYLSGIGYNAEIFCEASSRKASPGEAREVKEGIQIIFAGKITQSKGAASLIRSMDYLAKKMREDPALRDKAGSIRLFLAGGSGNREEYAGIRKIAERSPIPVDFLGRLPQKELADRYRESDVFVLPSFGEGLPLTLIEALACGDRAVVTDLPGIRPFLTSSVPDAPVFYVKAPKAAEKGAESGRQDPKELKQFEQELADQIAAAIAVGRQPCPDLSEISWKAVCKRVLCPGKERLENG